MCARDDLAAAVKDAKRLPQRGGLSVLRVRGGVSISFLRSTRLSRRPASRFATRTVAQSTEQRGRVVLATFLYTHCPDVCPLIAENLNQALRQLGPGRSQVRVLAVSVDPQGDTKAAVRSYARIHRLLPQFRYLIGTRAELEPVWRAWHVAAVARNPELVDHTAYTALLDRQGRQRATYDARVRARDVVHDVRLLLKG